MSASTQPVDISVLGKKSAVSKYGVGPEITLNEPSIVQIAITRADIREIGRQGDDLILTLIDGQVVTVTGYFQTVDGQQSHVVLLDEMEGLWLLNTGEVEEDGVMPFGFTNLQSIDPLLDSQPAEERDAVLGVWHSALAGLTIAAIAANQLLGGPDPVPTKPKNATVDLVNGVDPITGTAEPGMTVTVILPDGKELVTIAGSDGHYSIPNPGLSHGDEIQIVVTSPEGVDSDPITAIVDALAPDKPVVEPVNAQDDIVVHAEPGSKVTVKFPDGSEQSVEADEDGNAVIKNPGLEDGDKLTVTATDPAGNSSEPTEAVVDAAPPVLTITDDVSEMVGVDGSVTFTFTFNEDVVGFDASKIKVTGGTVGEFTAVSGSVYTLVVTPPAGSEGEITVEVAEGAAHDAAKNPSKAAEATQAYDTIAPSIDALKELDLWDDVGPVQGKIVSGDTTDDNKPEYKGKVDPTDVTRVQVLDNGKVIGTADVAADGSWSFEPKLPLAAGPHVFQVRLMDAAGNLSETSPELPFTLIGPAPAAPAITGIYNDEGDALLNIQPGMPANDATPMLKGTATPGTTIKVYDGDKLVGSTEVDADGMWTLNTSELADGNHQLTATATDGAGQVSEPTGEYLVVIDTVAPAQPDMVEAIDSVGDKIGPINVGDTVDDWAPEFKGKGDPGDTVTLYDNGKIIGSTVVGKDGLWSITPADSLAEGPHSITTTLTDRAGNTSEPSEALTFNVDTSGVELVVKHVMDDVGSITGAIPNGGVTDDTTPTFEGRATPGAEVRILEGDKEIASAKADDQGNWSITLPEQPEGEHHYTVVALSVAGNEVKEPFSLTVDTTPSSVPSIGSVLDDVGSKQGELQSGDTTDDTTPQLKGKGTPGDTINIYDNGELVDSTIVDGDGNWSYTIHPALTHEGEHEFTTSSVDAAGNESDRSPGFTIQLDVTPPDVSGVVVDVDDVTEDNVLNAKESQSDVTLTGSLSEVPDDVTDTQIVVTVNGVDYKATIDGDRWSVDVPGSGLLADSDQQIDVVASFSDAAGNAAQKVLDKGYDIDVTPPNLDELLFEYRLMDDVGEKQGEILNGDITDDSKPRYIGKTDPQEVATVEVLNKGVVIGVAKVEPDGTWWVEPNSPLAAGPHSFQLRAIDAAGNESLLTKPLEFTVLGAAPQAPSITGVYDDNDGNIQPHQPTKDSTPTLKGTAALGTIVKVYDGDTLVGSAEVDGKGNWSISTDVLKDGLHELTATATDGAGQVSERTGIYPVLVDTLAPERPDMIEAYDHVGDKTGLIAAGDTVDDWAPELKGKGEVGATVTITDNGKVIGTTVVGADGTWSLKPAQALGEGAHSISVTLTDKAGNTSESSDPLTFTVDTSGLELVIVEVLDDVGTIRTPISDGGATDDTTPTFVGRATPGATVSIYESGTLIKSVKSDGSGHWSIELPAQSEGSHSYTVKAESASGNVSEVPYTLTIDTTPSTIPVITEIHDSVGSVQTPITNGGVTDDTTPELFGKGTAGDTINVYDNGSYVGSTVVDQNGEWNYVVHPALTNEGEHKLTATSVDAVGNESAHSDGFVIQLDVTPPDLSGTQLIVNNITDDNVLNAAELQGEITISGQILDVPSDVVNSKVVVSINGNKHVAEIVGDTWQVTAPGSELAAASSVEVTASFGDLAGNVAQLQSTKPYDISQLPPDASTLYDIVLWDDVEPKIGEINAGDLTNDSKPEYRGKAEIGKVAFVEILDNHVVIGKVPVAPDGTWSFEPELPLQQGEHSFTARPVDASNNVGPETSALPFGVVSVKPQAPSITGVYDDAGGNIQPDVPTKDSTPTIKGTAAPGTDVEVRDGNNKLIGSATVNSKGEWEMTVSSLDDGVNDLTAVAVDGAGQVSDPTSYSLIVDTIAPDKPSILDAIDDIGDTQGPIGSGGITDDARPEFKGKGEAGAVVTVFDNGEIIGTTTVDASGEWAFSPAKALTDGAHSITATLTDRAGNTSAPSSPFDVEVDTRNLELVITEVQDDHGTIRTPISDNGATDDTTPTFVGLATAGAKVTIYEGGTEVASTTADLDGHWSIELPVQSEGLHKYSIKALSSSGNTAEESFTLTVDTTPSSIPTIGSVHDNVGSIQKDLSPGDTTDDTTPALTGTGTPGDSVNIYDNGTKIGTATVGPDGKWDYTVHPAMTTEGEHKLTVTSVDAVGNESAHSDGFIIHLDVTPPDVSGVQIVVNGVTDDNIINAAESQGQIELTGSLQGLPPDVAESLVTITIDGTKHEAQVIGDAWSVTVPGSALASNPSGKFDVTVELSDAAGNSADLSTSKDYGVMTELPTAGDITALLLWDDVAPVEGEIVDGSATDDRVPTYSGKADPAKIAKVEILDHGKVIGFAEVKPDGTWSFEPGQELVGGMHEFQARPVDVAGNVGSATPSVSFDVLVTLPQPPTIGGLEDKEDLNTDGGGDHSPGLPPAPPPPLVPPTQPKPQVPETQEPEAPVEPEEPQVPIEPEQPAEPQIPVEPQQPEQPELPLLPEEEEEPEDVIPQDPPTGNIPELVPDGSEDDEENEQLLLEPEASEPPVLNDEEINMDLLTQAKMAKEFDNMGAYSDNARSTPTLVTRDTTPTLKGTATPGTLVTLYDILDSGEWIKVGSFTASAQGTWSITTTLLSESMHNFIATSTDAAGQVSAPSVEFKLLVDITPPERPGVPQVEDNSGDVVGTVVNGGVTDETQPLIRGQGEAGAKVKIFDNGQLIGNTVADSEGNWSYQPATPLTDGEHSITATLTDSAGNVSAASDPMKFTLDTTAVQLKITEVIDDVGEVTGTLANGAATDDATPTFKGEATAGSTVTIYEDGKVVASGTADAKGLWEIELPVQTDGKHAYTVKAVNAAGNEVTAEYQLEVDTVASSAPVIEGARDNVGPEQGDLVSASITDDATPELFGKAAAGETVRIHVNGTQVDAVTADASGQWTCTVDLAPFGDGKHQLTATSVDAVGNVSAPSAAFELTLDTAAPDVTNANLTINNVTEDNIVNQAESQGDITLTGKLTGVPADARDTSIIVSVNGQDYKATLDGTLWSVAVPGKALIDDPDLTVDVTANFQDEAGNIGKLNVSKTYETKAEPPAVGSVYDISLIDDVGLIQGPISEGAITDDREPTYIGKADHPEVAKVEVLDGGVVVGVVDVKSDGSWSFEPATSLHSGKHSFQARPIDYAGNVGTPSTPLSFEVAGAAPTPPFISGLDDDGALDAAVATFAAQDWKAQPFAAETRAGGEPDIITNKVTPTLKGTATPHTIVKVYDMLSATDWVLMGTTTADASGNWSLVTLELSEGMHNFIATSTDEAGQVSGPSFEFNVLVDITAPVSPEISEIYDDVGSVTGPVPDGGSTDDKLPTISGQGEAGAKVTVYDNGVVIGTATVDASGQWSMEPTKELAEGAHAITVKQTDKAGNVSVESDVTHFTVDSIAPALTSSIFYYDNVGEKQGQFGSGTTTDDRTPTLFGSLMGGLDAGDQVVVYDGSTLLGTAFVSGNDWRFDLPEALLDGTYHEFSVRVRDAAGNEGTAASLALNVALAIGVTEQTTTDTTPIIAGTISAEILPDEHVEVTINGVTYSSVDGAVAVDVASGTWYVQIPNESELGYGRYEVSTQLVSDTGDVALSGSGVVTIEPPVKSEVDTNWAYAAGETTNNTMLVGLNDDGLWTIGANRQIYSSTDVSDYNASMLVGIPKQKVDRTVVSMTAADFDRNGTADVFGTESRSDGNYQIMWRNTGNGYAAEQLSTGCETLYWGGVIAYDKTGDGYLDLAYGDRYGNSVTYISNDRGTLTPDGGKKGNAGMKSSKQDSYGELSAVDLNGDGAVDIVRHDSAQGKYALSVINNNGMGDLTPGQSIANVFYKNEKNSVTTASMTWADFNGDGYMDLYLATGRTHANGVIYYNDGAGNLRTQAAAVETPSTSIASAGFLSAAVDWNHDGRMDVIKLSPYGTMQTAKLFLNNEATMWTTKLLSASISNATGLATLDYNWDGARDLIVSQQNGKMVYVQNNEAIAKGSAMHLHIVDSEGINVYYGNTVQLYDSNGKLVAAQIINPQAGYGFNDTSAIVSFYGLDPQETYTAKLLKVTNGISANESWTDLVAGDGKDAFMLTAKAATGGDTAKLSGTGYNDTFIAEEGTYIYDGGGGWTTHSHLESWNKTGGMDVVDFRNATSGVNVDLSKTGMQFTGYNVAQLVDIEGVTGSDHADVLVGSLGDNIIEGRGGDDLISIGNGGKDTLMYRVLDKLDGTGGNGSDQINGFSVGAWESSGTSDRIDLSELLIGYQPITKGEHAARYIDGVATINHGDKIADYLRVETTATGTELQIDRYGDGINYTSLLTLNGVHTDLATLLANHQITLV